MGTGVLPACGASRITPSMGGFRVPVRALLLEDPWALFGAPGPGWVGTLLTWSWDGQKVMTSKDGFISTLGAGAGTQAIIDI